MLDGPLLPAGLTERLLERALRRGGDFADLYVERRSTFSVALDDRRLERAQSGRETGASLRVVVGDSTYFAHVDGLAEGDLERLADEVSAAVRLGTTTPRPLRALIVPSPQEIKTPPGSVPAARKAELLRECDERARAAGDAVTQVSAAYNEARREVQVANSDGLLAADDRTRVRLGAQVVARREDRVESGMESLAGHAGFELFAHDPAAVADEAARRALTMLDARPAPAGPMPVVVGNGFGGVLFHEATGHGLESDAVQKHASVYEGRVGEQLAPPIVSAYDDGTMPHQWGTDAIDDEGTPCQATRVIDEGRLCVYLYDLLRARREGRESTGNGRRQSFRHLPIPRMTNTYIAPGDATRDEIIAGVDRGLYAVSFAGGQVEPATGDFVFGVSEGYLIEGGHVTAPVRGATLIGNGIEVLSRIDAVGGDLAMKSGFCGKDGQQVPVGTGQPTVRISELTVGGTDV
ncbi:MAG: TldD/PmbA family protein [Solirubrobacterales bacterium]